VRVKPYQRCFLKQFLEDLTSDATARSFRSAAAGAFSTRHLWAQADYGIFYAGKFLKEESPGRNLNYWAL